MCNLYSKKYFYKKFLRDIALNFFKKYAPIISFFVNTYILSNNFR